MTTLQLARSDSPERQPDPPDLQMRVKWHVVTAWLVAALLGTNGYRMVASPEPPPSGDAQAIKELRSEVSRLSQQVAVLIAIVERIEDQKPSSPGYRRR